MILYLNVLKQMSLKRVFSLIKWTNNHENRIKDTTNLEFFLHKIISWQPLLVNDNSCLSQK